MPQIDQLPVILFSQLFWLLLVFGIIYFVIGRGMVPKIQSVVADRDKKIADDLAAAQRARDEAEQTEARYRERMDEARGEAMKLGQAAKQKAGKDSEAKVKAVDAKINAKVAEAQERIRASVDKARGEIETVAADAARELVVKLAGTEVAEADARRAVKAALNG